jgi:hypothetical protein
MFILEELFTVLLFLILRKCKITAYPKTPFSTSLLKVKVVQMVRTTNGEDS